MKKVISMCLLCILLLTACAPPTPPIEETTTDTPSGNETTTPEEVETTTPEEDETDPPTYEERFAEVLKKYGYTSIDDFKANSPGKPLHPLNVSVNDVYVGMPLMEFEKLICFLDLMVYEHGSPFWFYWVDKDQNYVITVFDGSDGELNAHTVREIKVFENVKEDVTKEEILLITPGMHLYDVIEAVGFPRYNSMSGNRATSFGSARYQLVFDTDTMTLKINEPLLRQEYESMQNTTETTNSENSTNVPESIE
ncbi:MAG: hypothetical protein IJX80_10030 [Clostridia bacterium]|nr:hypothetical protein [Clostridia bacterium]